MALASGFVATFEKDAMLMRAVEFRDAYEGFPFRRTHENVPQTDMTISMNVYCLAFLGRPKYFSPGALSHVKDGLESFRR
jgi:hypothetical protein